MNSSLRPFLVVVDRELAFLDAVKKFLEKEFIDCTVLVDPGPIDAINTLNALTGKAIFILGYDLGDMTGAAVAGILKKNFRYSAKYILLTPKDDHELSAQAYDNDLIPFSKEPPPGGELYNLGRLLKSLILFAERELNKDLTDLLTGAYTRRQALEIWRKDFAQAKKSRTTTCFVYLDLNYFGLINKICGDSEGDSLLQRFAECLRRSVLSADDVICRQGGDEFLVILVNANRSKMFKFIQNVDRHVAEILVEINGMSIPMSTAHGYAVVPFGKLHPHDAHETLKEAARIAAGGMRAYKARNHAEIMRGPYGETIRRAIEFLKGKETGG